MIDFIAIALVVALLGYLIEMVKKPLIEKFAEKTINKMLSDMKEGKATEVSLEDRRYGIIKIRNDGFQIKNGKNIETIDVEWNDVSEIFAYKKDLFTTDLICLGWKLISTNETVETHEEMSGFKKLCDAMVAKFKTISAAWYMDVAHPAFETNLTLLWSKKKDISNEETVRNK